MKKASLRIISVTESNNRPVAHMSNDENLKLLTVLPNGKLCSDKATRPGQGLHLHVMCPDTEKMVARLWSVKQTIRKVTFDPTVTRIGREAFLKCSELSTVVFPEQLKEIGEYAFDGCHKLSTVTFPQQLRSIHKNAFLRCSSLTSVVFLGELPRIDPNAFRDTEIDTRYRSSQYRTSGGNVKEYLQSEVRRQRCRTVLLSLQRLRPYLNNHTPEGATPNNVQDPNPITPESNPSNRLNGYRAASCISSDDLWRYIIEFV